jgi:hypothetical protein
MDYELYGHLDTVQDFDTYKGDNSAALNSEDRVEERGRWDHFTYNIRLGTCTYINNDKDIHK